MFGAIREARWNKVTVLEDDHKDSSITWQLFGSGLGQNQGPIFKLKNAQ